MIYHREPGRSEVIDFPLRLGAFYMENVYHM